MFNNSRLFVVFVFAFSALLLPVLQAPYALASEDNRQLVKIKPEMTERFLAEMRQDLDHLDDLLSAVSEGNFEEAARIAERRMGLAHKRIEMMVENGVPDAKIAEFIARVRKLAESDETDLTKALHGKGRGRGVGQFMPEELRAMGQEMHKAAYAFADIARAAKTPPTAGDYKRLFSAVNDITTLCRSCHDTFRVR